MYYYYTYPSPVGRLTVASDQSHIVGLWPERDQYYMDVLKGKECREQETDVIRRAAVWLGQYFDGKKPEIHTLPLAFTGSDFRKRVWKLLMEIPYGETVTYGQLSRKIACQTGVPAMSAQAVGGAVGHNPISIIVPCHRVVGAGGNLTGYAGGIQMKTALLRLEGVDTTKLK